MSSGDRHPLYRIQRPSQTSAQDGRLQSRPLYLLLRLRQYASRLRSCSRPELNTILFPTKNVEQPWLGCAMCNLRPALPSHHSGSSLTSERGHQPASSPLSQQLAWVCQIGKGSGECGRLRNEWKENSMTRGQRKCMLGREGPGFGLFAHCSVHAGFLFVPLLE